MKDRRLLQVVVTVLVAALLPDCTVRADDVKPLDQEVLEALEGQPAADSLERIIPRLINGTMTAAERMGRGELGVDTARVQAQVLADLDALLSQSSPPGQPPQNGADNSQSQEQQQQQDSQSQQEPSQDQADSQEDGKSDPNAAAKESEERSARGEWEVSERERRLGLSTAAWGHLPPKVREQMRSAFSEEYLPEYDSLVRRYYEALARRRDSPH